jgi:hypothetical protein
MAFLVHHWMDKTGHFSAVTFCRILSYPFAYCYTIGLRVPCSGIDQIATYGAHCHCVHSNLEALILHLALGRGCCFTLLDAKDFVLLMVKYFVFCR